MRPFFLPGCLALLLSSFLHISEHALQAEDVWQAGLAKVDITPTEAVRLSGYAVRVESHQGVADPLSARALVLSPASQERFTDSVVLVSLDSIAVTNGITLATGRWLEETHHIPRSQLVISSTHSHAAPHLSGGLNNLYPQRSTPEQVAATERYTEQVLTAIQEVIAEAIKAQVPAKLEVGEASAGFATNRRLFNFTAAGGTGEPPVGPLDQRVRVLQVTATGGDLLGAAFMYACHCTTLGSEFNQISGDWAGLAAGRLEQSHPGIVVLPIIGCGADANPNPRGSYELAGLHAAQIVTAVEHVFAQEGLVELTVFPQAQFGYAGLVPENPTAEFVKQKLKSESNSERYWAEHMQEVWEKMGRLPESYPMPIHTWQFGEELTWVFLGGEVVADYQLNLEKLLPTKNTWVAAYCDDVFAYVASERLRPEGGYEVDQSMIYYLQPGRWESGTQALIEKRVLEILQQERSDDKPFNAAEAIAAVHVPAGYRVDLVASEPLVADPINIAFGIDGRVWVVEMSDYPLGTPGGGRVKWLRDNNSDGKLDEVGIFLEGLSYPTSVMPWRDGVLVIAAPDVIYAEDINQDGIADRKETLLTGIGEANPQHRASGFEIGLDGWLHFAAGADTKQLRSLRNNQTYDVHGHDVAWHPDSGAIRFTSGETQFIRARDEYGNWFGNSNSYPMYQFVIDQRYLAHGSVAGGVQQQLLTPAVAPPVHPRSRTVDRFNDQYARDRFTSACSSIIARVPGVRSVEVDGGAQVGFICEPVHNMVARIQLDSTSSAFKATRHPEDTEFDFLGSTDVWSRPVRAVNAPDGSIWVLDMVRRVIEHPQWIPTAWQERLDLRSGSNLGRIYRVYREDFEPTALNHFAKTPESLLSMLSSDNGSVRDLALQEIVCGDYAELEAEVRRLAVASDNSAVRASALGCLSGKGWLQAADVIANLHATEPPLVRLAIELAETWSSPDASLQAALTAVVARELGPQVDLQWVLTSTLLADFDSSAGLKIIADRSRGEEWIGKALTLVMGEKEAYTAVASIFDSLDAEDWESQTDLGARSDSLLRLWKRADAAAMAEFVSERKQQMLTSEAFRPSDVLLLALASPPASAKTTQRSIPGGSIDDLPLDQQIAEKYRARLLDSQVSVSERAGLASLLGRGVDQLAGDVASLEQLLQSDSDELMRAAIGRALSLADERVPHVLLGNWGQLSSAARSAVCSTLLRKSDWTRQLLEKVEIEAIARRELDPSTVQQLRNYPDPKLRERAASVLGKPTERAPLVARYVQGLPSELDAEAAKVNGQKLYTEHCGVCHAPKPGQPALGPTVENLAHWTNEQWVTAVLDPNQTIEPKFQQSLVMTVDGQITAGIVVEKSSQSLKLATTDGRIQELALQDVEEVKQLPISLMPEGFEEKLSPQQLSEIMHFLRNK